MDAKRQGWGLIGPGRFAREFAAELRTVSGAYPAAVGSRSRDRAQCFADEFGFERVHDSYEALIDDPEVDIVYIVVPHVFHAEIARMAIACGKPVVCEKPLTASVADTEALLRYARDKGVFLMEAMKTAFLPAVGEAVRWIAEGRIGEPRLLRADFCFPGPDDPGDRLMNPDLGGGAILDVGIYPLHLAQFLFGELRNIEAVGTLSETGVEDTVSVSALAGDDIVCSLACSFRTQESMSAEILGTEGRIVIPVFHAATRAVLYRDGELRDFFTDDSGSMVGFEIAAAMKAVVEGRTECPGHDHAASLRLARAMAAVIARMR